MYDGIQFCVRCGDDQMMGLEQKIGVWQGCSLSPYLLNILFGNAIDAAREGNKHAPLIWKVSVPGLSFVGSFGNPWITERIRPNSQIL
jgi:hypothetical protein